MLGKNSQHCVDIMHTQIGIANMRVEIVQVWAEIAQMYTSITPVF